jgi:hypothetical protein
MGKKPTPKPTTLPSPPTSDNEDIFFPIDVKTHELRTYKLSEIKNIKIDFLDGHIEGENLISQWRIFQFTIETSNDSS